MRAILRHQAELAHAVPEADELLAQEREPRRAEQCGPANSKPERTSQNRRRKSPMAARDQPWS